MWDRCEERGTGCSFCQIWKRQNVKYPPYDLRVLARAESLTVPVLVLSLRASRAVACRCCNPAKSSIAGRCPFSLSQLMPKD